jgi:ADP-L-glycero-D-manno-heptose 6-epimerase
MDRNDVILVTGAAGFIGSCMVGYLNRKGFQNIIIVDDFSRDDKRLNYEDKKICARVDRDELFDWLSRYQMRIDFVFHLGARTDTTEFDYSIHERLNVEYSKKIWIYCTGKNIPLVYASSAATYGSGELGYKDDHSIVEKLQPLNPYGVSKNEFDKWVLKQTIHPPFWAGLKFFNVYGPNEYHKGRMASVIFHAYNQVKSTGKVKLFKSHKPGYKDGEQLRDFVYVKDVVDICQWLMQHQPASGLYNLGTGKARTFKDLVTAIFTSLELKPNIEYIDTPEDIRDKYQYFTEADMDKLQKAGYKQDFYSLEDGVDTYVQHFLQGKKYY